MSSRENSLPRIDKKHRFPLRIKEVLYHECEVLSFRQDLSMNLLLCEAVDFALNSPSFIEMIDEKYKRDERKGHFVYIQDEQTNKKGKML